MRYLSVCSGIEAATVAWHPLGWEPVAFSEIDAFPSAVLKRHYPNVPNWGDMTRFHEWPRPCACDVAVESPGPRRVDNAVCDQPPVIGNRGGRTGASGDLVANGGTCGVCGGTAFDLLVGGTPCQSFSVAGLRKGLDDPRGNLMLVYLALARRYRPRWLVWENVPGVLSSDDGRAFGSLLGGLAELGYGFAYRVLDAQHFGLAQRRQRVFVVGCLGDWRRAAAVLFERASLSGHPAPRREAGQVAPTVPARRTAGGGLGTDFDCDGGLIAALIAQTLTSGGTGMRGHLDPVNTTLIPIAFDARQSDVIQYGDQAGPLDPDGHSIAVAFSAKDYGGDAGDIAPTPRAGGHTSSHANGGVMPAVAFAQNTRDEVREMAVSGALSSQPGMKQTSYVRQHMAVRRLTPLECCRLQGFPDDYLDILYRGKPAADGPKYKALGNSFAVPVVRWIGQRIQMVEDLCSSANSAA